MPDRYHALDSLRGFAMLLGVVLHAGEVTVTDATVGFVNREASPDYRVFLANAALTIENFSNQKSEGFGRARLTGQFMGSGPTTVAVSNGWMPTISALSPAGSPWSSEVNTPPR